jgi:hypothetical protein
MALLDTNPLAQLLGQEQYGQAKTDALNMGALNAIAQLLSLSGPQARPVGTGQAIGQALLGGYQGYQGAMDKTLKEMLTATQLSDTLRKQKEAQQIKSVLASAARPVYEQTPASTTYEGEDYAMGGQKLVGMTYDMKSVIPTLQALGRFDLIKDIGESSKVLRQSGIMSDGAQAPSPFAPYLNAQNPQVRTLAAQLQSGFERGIIDEETAFKRLDPLAKMEESYIARVDKQAEGAKPTESQYKAATLGGRLENALGTMKKVGEKNEEALKPEFFPELLQGSFLQYIPGTNMLAGKISSEDRLRAEAAQLDALDAALTLGTGAAYTREQLKGYAKSFFPQKGDTTTVIQEKNERFANLVELARLQAGPAAKNIDLAREKANIFNVDEFIKNNNLEGKKKK